MQPTKFFRDFFTVMHNNRRKELIEVIQPDLKTINISQYYQLDNEKRMFSVPKKLIK